MATNEVFRQARRIALPVPAGLAAGSPVKVGALVGVTETAEGAGENIAGYATVWLEGAHLFTVSGAIAGPGTAIYVDSSNNLTTTASGNTLFGWSIPKADGSYATKAAGSGVALVKIVTQ
jgi:predicted RecA/RadA family phage recombinase